jgi:prevent-host-death family protein
MKETVTTIEVRQKLGDLLNRVDLRHDQFIIERKGKPLAALVPVEKLEQMDRAARLLLLEVLDRRKETTASLSQAEADLLADEAKHRQRKAKRR